MLQIADREFHSRLFIGTGKFSSAQVMLNALARSGTEMVTLALSRVDIQDRSDELYEPIVKAGYKLLPNTSGARTAEEAIFAAQLASEAMDCNWIKLEIHPDARHLMPDPVETLIAAERLVQEGFVVLPYMHADPVLAKRLEECGCAAVMPLGAPIGSNQGLQTLEFLRMIIDQSTVPVVIDAGLGTPSHAMQAMELGADAVLVNTAIATAKDPVRMASAFAGAVFAGREARLAGIKSAGEAEATSPLTDFLEDMTLV